MKYILYPLWIIICLGLLLFELLAFAIYHILGFLWTFFPVNLTWEMFTKQDSFWGTISPGYDKNPKETFIRYLTLGEYKNHE
jgi:hypothetical protein